MVCVGARFCWQPCLGHRVSSVRRHWCPLRCRAWVWALEGPGPASSSAPSNWPLPCWGMLAPANSLVPTEEPEEETEVPEEETEEPEEETEEPAGPSEKEKEKEKEKEEQEKEALAMAVAAAGGVWDRTVLRGQVFFSPR